MAYFSNNEPERTQSIPYANGGADEQRGRQSWADYQTADGDDYDDSYDDGFDQLMDDGVEDEEYEEYENAEQKEIRKVRLQTLFDVSNLTATIIGALLILLLLQLLFSMIDYVRTDFELNFSLLMSRI